MFNNIIRRFVLFLSSTMESSLHLKIWGFYSAKKLFLHCILYYHIYFIYSVLFFDNSNYLSLCVCFLFSGNVFLVPSHMNTHEQMTDTRKIGVSLFSFPCIFTAEFSNSSRVSASVLLILNTNSNVHSNFVTMFWFHLSLPCSANLFLVAT